MPVTPGSSQPFQCPSVKVAVVDFKISDVAGGYLFEWCSKNTDHRIETWHHQILQSALEEAKLSFGIESGEWQSVDPTEPEDFKMPEKSKPP